MDQPKQNKKKAAVVDLLAQIQKVETPKYIRSYTETVTGSSVAENTTSVGSTGLGSATANASLVTTVEDNNQKMLLAEMKKAAQIEEEKKDKEVLASIQKAQEENNKNLKELKINIKTEEDVLNAELDKIYANLNNYEGVTNPLGAGAMQITPQGKVSFQNHSLTGLKKEVQDKINQLKAQYEAKVAPKKQQYVGLLESATKTSLEGANTKTYQNSVKTIAELEKKYSLIDKKSWSGDFIQKQANLTKKLAETEENPLVKGKLIFNSFIDESLASVLYMFRDLKYNTVNAISPIEDKMTEPEKALYQSSKKLIRDINTPIAQHYIEKNSKLIEEIEKKQAEYTIADKDYWKLGTARSKVTRSLELAEDFSEGRGLDAGVFYDEVIGKNFIGIDGRGYPMLLERTKNSLVELFIEDEANENYNERVIAYAKENKKAVDNLEDEDYKNVYNSLSDTDKMMLSANFEAQVAQGQFSENMSFGYKTAVGTGHSVDFMKDIPTGKGLVTGGLKLFKKGFSLLSKTASDTNKISKTYRALSKVSDNPVFLRNATRVAEGSKDVAQFTLESAAITYINPKAINERLNVLGYQAIQDEEGNVETILTREGAKNHLIKKTKENMDTYAKLEKQYAGVDVESLSEEDKNNLEFIKAKLGKTEIKGVTTFEQDLDFYENALEDKAISHIKGIASTGVEKFSELYTGKSLGFLGKQATRIPGANKLITTVKKGTDKIDLKLSSTTIGKKYKDWQNLVSKINVDGTSIIGSVPEEIVEEYVAAAGSGLIDWDFKELNDAFTGTDFLIDVSAQTLLMNATFGVAGASKTNYQLAYNKLANYRLQQKEKEIEKLQEYIKTEQDQNLINETKISLATAVKDRDAIKENMALGLGRIIPKLGPKTAYSGTKNFIESRKETRAFNESLRKVSNDEELNSLIDMASANALTETDYQNKILKLKAEGKKEEAKLAEKVMARNVVFNAFQSGTEKELRSSLQRALRNTKELSPERVKSLVEMEKMIGEITEFKEKHATNPGVNIAASLMYSKASARKAVEETNLRMTQIASQAEEEFESYFDAYFQDAGVSKEEAILAFRTGEILNPTSNDSLKNTVLANLADKLLDNNSSANIAKGYLNGIQQVQNLKSDVANINIAINEAMYPPQESINGRKLQTRFSSILEDLSKGVNSLDVSGIEYDDKGNIKFDDKLLSTILDTLKEESVGEVVKGKVSEKYFNVFKNRQLDIFKNKKKSEDLLQQIIQQMATSTNEIEIENAVSTTTTDTNLTPSTSPSVGEPPIIIDNDAEIVFVNAVGNLDATVGGLDFGDPDAVEDDPFDGELGEFLEAPYNFNQETLSQVKEVIKNVAEELIKFTGSEVTFDTAMAQIIKYSSLDKETIRKAFPYFIESWKQLGYKNDGGQIAFIINNYFNNTDSLQQVASTIKNIFEKSTSNESFSSVELEQEKSKIEEQAKQIDVKNKVQELNEVNAPVSAPISEENSIDTSIGIEPHAGFNSVEYVVVEDPRTGEERKETVSRQLNIKEQTETGFIRIDFRDLINPDMYQSGDTLAVEIADESIWGRIVESEYKDPVTGESMYITFASWLQNKESNNPNFRDTQEFKDKLPVFITDSKGKRLAYVHDTSWYTPYTVSAPAGSTGDILNPDGLWLDKIEASKENTRKLREAIITGGVRKISIQKPEIGKFGELPREMSLITLRESNPQADIVIQTGKTAQDFSNNLPDAFKTGDKKILNKETDFGADTDSHTFVLHRVGTEITTDGRKIETYFAAKVNRVLSSEVVENVKWAIAVNKFLRGEKIPDTYGLKGLTPQEVITKYVVPVQRATGLDISKNNDLAQFASMFLKVNRDALNSINEEIQKRGNPNFKPNASTDYLAIVKAVFENENTTLELINKGIVVQNTSAKALKDNSIKAVTISNSGVQINSTEGGKNATYKDFLMDSLLTNLVAYNVSTVENKPLYTLVPQPKITLSFSTQDITNIDSSSANLQQKVQKAMAEAIVELETPIEEVTVVTTQDINNIVNEIENLGVNWEAFVDSDDLIGDVEELRGMLQLTEGYSIFQEEIVRKHIASLIISKAKFKEKLSLSSVKQIESEIKEELSKHTSAVLSRLRDAKAILEKANIQDERIPALSKAIQSLESNINALEENFESIYQKSYNDVNEQTKLIKEEDETEDNLLNEEEEIEKNYSKDSVEEKLKDKSSAKLKMLFFGIPSVDTKGNIRKGYLGFPEYLTLNDVYNLTLKYVSAGIDPLADFGEIIKRLEKSEHPAIKEVIVRLTEADLQLQNEFVTNVAAHSLSSRFAMYQQGKVHSELKLYETNAGEISRIITNRWKSQSVASDLYNSEGDVNVEYATQLLNEFSELGSLGEKFDYDKSRAWLEKVGIDFKNETWNEILSKGVIQNGQVVTFEKLFTAEKGGLFKSITKFLKDASAKPEDYSLNSSMNILSDLSGVSKAISMVEAKYNPELIALSYRDSGKSISTLTPPKYMSDAVSRLIRDAFGDNSYIDSMLNLSYSSKSLILETLKELPDVKNHLKLHHVALTAIKEKNAEVFGNKKAGALSELDFDILTLTAFQDRKVEQISGPNRYEGFSLRMANMMMPTMSDKDTSLIMTTPVFDFLKDSNMTFTLDGKRVGLSIYAKELLFNLLIKPELQRIHKFHNDVKKTNIKGYDKAAGLFHLIPGLNAVKDETGKNIVQRLAEENMDFNTAMELFAPILTENIEKVIRQEVLEKAEAWRGVGLSKDDKTGKTTNVMFSETYFTEKGVDKDPVSDFGLGIWDYVMNSMIFNAEVFKVFAGDVAQFSQDKLYKGHENIYALEATQYVEIAKKVGTNLGKRLAFLIAPGKKIAQSANEKYFQIALKDSIDISENSLQLIKWFYGEEEMNKAEKLLNNYKRYEKILDKFQQLDDLDIVASLEAKYSRVPNEMASIRKQLQKDYPKIAAYFDIESTDAQEYTTLTEHVEILFRIGRISVDNYKVILDKLSYQKDLTKEEISLVMQPIKPVHTGTYIDSALDINKIVYIKSSSVPLIPQLTKGTRLDDLRIAMETLESKSGGTFVRASYQTANKVGSVVESLAIDPFDKNSLKNIWKGFNEGRQDFDSDIERSVLTLDRNNFRIQQDVPFKSDKKKIDTVAMGTQIFKLLFSDGVFNEGAVFNYKGKNLTGKELHKEFTESFKTIITSATQDLFSSLGLDEKGNITDEREFAAKLQEVLYKEAKDRGYSLKSVKGLEIKELKDYGTGKTYFDFITPLWLSSDSNRYEALLNSIITNRIMKYKIPGNGFIAGSEKGFQFQENLKGIDESRIIYLDNWNGTELQATKVDGEEVTKAQVMVASKFKDNQNKLVDLFQDFNGTEGKYIIRKENGSLGLKENMIDTELFNLFSFRTPTSSHVSASSIEIVGILPPESGDLMVVPKNFTKQKGLDYDIDKESAYALNHYIDETGAIKVIDEKYVDNQTKGLRDMLEKLHFELESSKRKAQAKKTPFSYSAFINNLEEQGESGLNLLYQTLKQELGEDLDDILSPEISISQKLISLERKMKTKLAQNDFVRTHLSVYNSTSEEVQKKINKVLSIDFASEQAEQFEEWETEAKKRKFEQSYLLANPNALPNEVKKAYEDYQGNFTMLTYSYQKSKMDLGAVGKVAIGVYAVATTFNGLLHQTFEGKGTEIGDAPIMIGHFTSSSIGVLNSLAPTGVDFKDFEFGRSTAEVFAEKENTATDNEKEQILGRVGVNTETIGVDSHITLRGFDRNELGDSISYMLLSQPIIKELNSRKKNAKGILGEPVESTALISLLALTYSNGAISYTTDPVTDRGYFVDNSTGNEFFDETVGVNLTGKALRDGVRGLDNSNQIEALAVYLKLKEESDAMIPIMGALNANSLGKSVIEARAKYTKMSKMLANTLVPKAYQLVGTKVSGNVEGMTLEFKHEVQTKDGIEVVSTHIIPNTAQGMISAIGLKLGNSLFSRFFPYEDEGFNTVISTIFDISNTAEEFRTVDSTEKIVNEIKRYLYSNPVIGTYGISAVEKREELFVDKANNTSLAKYLSDTLKLKGSKYGKGIKSLQDNALVGKKFQFRIAKGEGLSKISYDNTASDNISEEALYNALPDLVLQNLPLPDRNGKPYTTRDLVEDLVSYSFLEGGVQEATQFIKFIPVELLSAMGAYNKKGDFLSINSRLQTYNPRRNSIKGPTFGDYLGVSRDENSNTVPKFVTQYFQHYPSKVRRLKKGTYKFKADGSGIIVDESEAGVSPLFAIKQKNNITLYKRIGNGNYVKIPTLESTEIREYNFNADSVVPVRELGKIPNTITKVGASASSVNTFDFNKINSVEDLLGQITKQPLQESHKHLSEVAKFLLEYELNPLQKDTVELGLLPERGRLTSKKLVINKDYAESQDTSNEDIASVAIHELVHAFTVKDLDKYYSTNPQTGEYELTNGGVGVPAHILELQLTFSEYVKKGKFDREAYNTFKENYKIVKQDTAEMLARVSRTQDPNKVKEANDNIQAIKSMEESEFLKIYAAYNIKEFVAITLQNKEFLMSLNDIEYKSSSKSLKDKFVDALMKMFKEMFEGLKENSLAESALRTTLNFISEERTLKSQNNSISSQSTPTNSVGSTSAVYNATEDNIFEDPDVDTGYNKDPDVQEEGKEDLGEFLLEVGISREDWSQLSEEEKQKIKECK